MEALGNQSVPPRKLDCGGTRFRQPGEFTKRYRIVSKKKFLRSRPLPPRLFRMHGKHFLRMITCSDLVKLPDGYFHYTKNLVVTAEEVQ